MATQTNIPVFIGRDPNEVESILVKKGAIRIRLRFAGESDQWRHYSIGSESKSIQVKNDGKKVTAAYTFDNPDAGWMRDLQSPIVTKVLTTVVVGALTAGTAVGSTGDVGMTTSLAPGDVMDLSDFSDVAIDQSDAFNPFNFTDGESVSAWTDAQNVDFGFPADATAPVPDFADNPFQAIDPGQNPEVNFGTTQETSVSDFGSVNDPGTFINNDYYKLYKDVKGLPLTKPTTSVKQPQPTVRNLGGGINSPKNSFWTPTTARPSIGSNDGSSSTTVQKETSQIRNFFGQLTPGAKGEGVPVWLFLAGGALIVWGLVA